MNPISEKTLSELFGDSLTANLAINVEEGTEIWVVTGMLAHYLESFTDSVLVRQNNEPIGIVGGKEILERTIKNPTLQFFENTYVEEIMEERFTNVTKDTTLNDLINFWKETRRAFATVKNEFADYSAISARKILEVGKNFKISTTISELPEKEVITIEKTTTVGNVIETMLKNKTRKLLVKDSNEFISDRIILEKISEDLKFLKGVDDFLSLEVKNFKFEQTKQVDQDLTISQLSETLYNMEHPYVIWEDQVYSPWDVCKSLVSDSLKL